MAGFDSDEVLPTAAAISDGLLQSMLNELGCAKPLLTVFELGDFLVCGLTCRPDRNHCRTSSRQILTLPSEVQDKLHARAQEIYISLLDRGC